MSSQLEKNLAWESSALGTLYKQLFASPKPTTLNTNLSGKTAIITGANGGLGFEAARQLLRLGLSQLILTVRSESKGELTVERLKEEFPSADIQFATLDLSDYHSISAFAVWCQGLDRIDYVILNAALQNGTFEINKKTGHESVFQTNYLSTVLLMLLLTRVMTEQKRQHKRKQPPVLSVVGSDTMYFSQLHISGPVFPHMDDSTRFEKLRQYLDTKLLLMMFVSRLSQEVNSDDLLINVCNPGMTAGTNLGHGTENPGFVERYLIPLFIKTFGRSTEAGASVYIHALINEEAKSHGSFVSDWAIKPYPAIMYRKDAKDLMDNLWEETLEELKSSARLDTNKFKPSQ